MFLRDKQVGKTYGPFPSLRVLMEYAAEIGMVDVPDSDILETPIGEVILPSREFFDMVNTPGYFAEPERTMCITNENWSWSRAAKTALALSKCNKDVTLYVRQNRMLETWYILDWEPDWNDSRWNQFEGMAFLNGQRV